MEKERDDEKGENKIDEGVRDEEKVENDVEKQRDGENEKEVGEEIENRVEQEKEGKKGVNDEENGRELNFSVDINSVDSNLNLVKISSINTESSKISAETEPANQKEIKKKESEESDCVIS